MKTNRFILRPKVFSPIHKLYFLCLLLLLVLFIFLVSFLLVFFDEEDALRIQKGWNGDDERVAAGIWWC